MTRVVLIFTFLVVLLAAVAGSDPQKGVTIHISGPVRIVIGCNSTQERREVECPEGFMKLNKKCFKLFMDDEFLETWERANSKCQSEGLRLAEPSDPVKLRKELYDIIGDDGGTPWLGARGDNSRGQFVWQSTSEGIPGSSSLWYTGMEGIVEGTRDMVHNRCLTLLVWSYTMDDKPTRPYGGIPCDQHNRPLCELVME